MCNRMTTPHGFGGADIASPGVAGQHFEHALFMFTCRMSWNQGWQYGKIRKLWYGTKFFGLKLWYDIFS